MTRRGVLLGLFLASLSINLGYVLAFDEHLAVESDARAYDQNAVALAQGEGFPQGGLQPKREPGMYVFLAGIYVMAGHNPALVRMIHAVMASTFCLLVFAIADRMWRGGMLAHRVPILAATLTVAYPGYVFYAGVLMRETLLTLLALLSFLFLTRYVCSSRVRDLVLHGAFAGLGALVDGRLLFFIPFLTVLSLVTRRGDWRGALKYAAVAMAFALLVISPWTIRNYVVLNRFVLLATAQYRGLWLASNPEGILEWDWEREPLRSLRDLPPAERDAKITELAWRNVREYPGTYARSAVVRFFRLWTGGHSNVMPLMQASLRSGIENGAWGYVAVKLLFLFSNWVYVAGGAAGILLHVRRFGAAAGVHLWSFAVYTSVLHMALFATPRYHIPAMPVLTIFLAGALQHAFGVRWRAFGLTPAGHEPDHAQRCRAAS